MHREVVEELSHEPVLSAIQRTMGAPIEGGTDADLEALFESLSSQ
jgi:hypothetical protein